MVRTSIVLLDSLLHTNVFDQKLIPVLLLVGWSNTISDPGFGGGSSNDASVKSKLINLMTSVRTLMRSMYPVVLSSRNILIISEIVPLIAVNTFIILYECALG